MKNFIIFLIIISSSLTFSQEKFFIYFKDKGINPSQSLNKTGEIYKEAENLLSKKSIERRKKTMGENYITYGDLPVNRSYIRQLKNTGIKIERELKWFNSVSAYLTDDQINAVEKLSFVEKVEPVKVIKYKHEKFKQENNINKINKINDPNYGPSLPQVELSDIPQVHSNGINGEGVLIGLLDSGFDWQTHESLRNQKVVAEYDFIFNDSITANQPGDHPDQHDHGTAVFSAIGGYMEGSIIGPAHGSSYILSKTEDISSETHVEEDNYAAALIWMEEFGVDITSSSLGYSTFDKGSESYTYEDMDGETTIVTKACEEAFKRGIVVLTSAGNEGNDTWKYITAPADGFNTIAIGAVNNNNSLASFSSVGPTYDGRIKPEIVAQGVSVHAARASTESSYYSAQGTSLSAPLASGCAGLLLSAHPHLLNTQVREILLKTAGNSDNPNNQIGYGLISAARAISYPNLEVINNTYKLHKIFIANNKINFSSAMLHYIIDENDTINVNLLSDDSLRFNYTFPSYSSNQHIQFYFSYTDSMGNSHREPDLESYSFSYGGLTILNPDDENPEIPVDYVLSHNYPNPFNSSTNIDFYASSNEKAELVIFNAIGEKIKSLFSGTTRSGKNTVTWNGKTDNNIDASSGFYYYILKLGDKTYTKKMILLK